MLLLHKLQHKLTVDKRRRLNWHQTVQAETDHAICRDARNTAATEYLSRRLGLENSTTRIDDYCR